MAARRILGLVGSALVLGSASVQEARAACAPLRHDELDLASVIAAAEVLEVRAGKAGARGVSVRVKEYLRGVGPETMAFEDPAKSAACPPASLEAGKTYLFLLREHPKGKPTPLSFFDAGAGLVPAVVPLDGEALETPLWSGGPATLGDVRAAAAALRPLVTYEPAAPTDRDRVTALLPAPLGCPVKGAARVKSGRIVSSVKRTKACTPLAAARPWVRVDLGRLRAGRYVHFNDGYWIGYLEVKASPASPPAPAP